MSDDQRQHSPRSKRPIVIVVLLLLVVGGVLYWKAVWQGPFYYAGTVEATRIDLPARVASVIDSIDVDEGMKIQKGQKLASLACEDLQLAGRLADENYERGLKLKAAGTISNEAFEAIQNRKQDSDTRLSWCTILSPVNGTVLDKFLEAKEWVNPGSRILSVADLSDLWAYFYVPSEVMSKLKVGTRVVAVIPELGRREFPGEIAKINDEAEFTPKNVQTRAERTRLVFGIKVAFKNNDGTLKPGMTIESVLSAAQ